MRATACERGGVGADLGFVFFFLPKLLHPRGFWVDLSVVPDSGRAKKLGKGGGGVPASSPCTPEEGGNCANPVVFPQFLELSAPGILRRRLQTLPEDDNRRDEKVGTVTA